MITRRMSEMEGDPIGGSGAGQCCFFCGEFIHDPAVMWHGSDSQNTNIYLHGPCVLLWTQGLWRDALELRYCQHWPGNKRHV